MANNTTLPGTGAIIATDDDGTGLQTQRVNINDLSFVERIVLKALTKLTFSLNGLRVDASGATVAVTISSGTVTTVSTVTSVTAVAASSNGALGRTTPDGQGIQLSYLAFQDGFRRNLALS